MSLWPFLVEYTSTNPTCPEQKTIQASDPVDAVRQMLDRNWVSESDLECYDGEKHPQYDGWARLTISVKLTPEEEPEPCEYPQDRDGEHDHDACLDAVDEDPLS